MENTATAEEIVKQLQRVNSGKNKEIQEATLILNTISNKNGFTNALLTIPLIDPIEPNIAKMAMTYTMTYCRKLVAQKNQSLINTTTNLMLEFLAYGAIDFRLRQQVAASLEYLVRMDTNGIILSIFHPNFVELLQKNLNAKFQQINFEFIALFADVLGDFGVNPANSLYPFIETAIIPLVTLTSRLIEYGSSQITANESAAERAFLLGSILTETVKKYLKKYLFLSSKTAETLFNPAFCNLINLCLNLTLPQNQLECTVMYFNEKYSFSKTVQLLHTLKSNAITILTQATRILHHTKEYDMTESQIFKQTPQFIKEFVRSINLLLEKTQFYKLRSVLQVRVVEEIFTYLIATVRSGKFFHTLIELKNMLIYGCIFKILAITPDDLDNYENEPDEFINSILQIVDLNVSTSLLSKKRSLIQKQKREAETLEQMQVSYNEDDDEEDHSTVRSIAANLFTQLCKYIDGCLSEMVIFSVQVLNDEINLELSKNLVVLALCILRDDVKERTDLLSAIGKSLINEMKCLKLPRKSEQVDMQNILYSLVMLAISRYVVLIYELFPDIFEKLFIYIESIMGDEEVEQVPQLMTCQLIINFMAVEEGSLYSIKLLTIFNKIINSATVNRRYLQVLELLIQENDFELKESMVQVHTMVERISALIQWELKKNKSNLMILNQLWHILTQIISSQYLMPDVAPKIEEALSPLISMADGSNDLHLDEKLYEIGCSILKRKITVGEFQLNLMERIPKSFYTGHNKYSLLSCFELLQNIAFYGSSILSSSLPATKTMILLCIDSINTKTANGKPRTEADQCQGLLILQSFIISCESCFDGEIWMMIGKNLVNKVQENSVCYDFHKATLLSVLSLTLMYGYKFFSEADNINILTIILQNCQCLESTSKISFVTISLGEMLYFTNFSFIANHFQIMFDCLITLLKVSVMKKTDIYERRELDSEEQHFKKLLGMSKSTLDNLDEFEHFRSQIRKIKENNSQILDACLNELPEIKKSYFRQIMSVKKVNNDARPVFKIRVKQQQ